MEPDLADNPADDVALIRRVAQGDRRGLEELYDRYANILFTVAHRVLNDQQATEDVLQDVFIQIWDKAPLYDASRGKPLTWAITLTRNKAIDQLRSIQRRGRLAESAEREYKALEQFDGPSAFDEVASGEAGRLVRQAILSLSPESREVIELAFFSSLTQAEIAERLQQPLGTVKARIRRALMKLREILGAQP
jgi:RNA polymerase sigma-70 factor (ECF subfamily)